MHVAPFLLLFVYFVLLSSQYKAAPCKAMQLGKSKRCLMIASDFETSQLVDDMCTVLWV